MQKKIYQTPRTESNIVVYTSILCASGDVYGGMPVISNPANNLIGD